MSVLLVQLDPLGAKAVATALEREGIDVAIADDARGGAADASSSDVVAIGLEEGFEQRLARCRDLREQGYLGAIIAVARDTVEVPAFLGAGADDFLIAPIKTNELVARVQFAQQRVVLRVRSSCGPIELDRLRRKASLVGVPLPLTAREYALLACLVETSGRVVSRAELLLKVWGHTDAPGTNLLEVHLSRLRSKLGPHAAMIETVRRVGYRLRA